MPKTIELTVEIDVQRVSCPGVWLCQDGRVSLTVYALGTRYQTGLLPPVFPLAFKDIFYFRKRFEETCALNNICCLLKEETIYCELVQWSEECPTGECLVLAQYLGTLNDVLFPPNMCSSDGVDLLMRRSKEYPGILAPKIEIATKVRIDEVWRGDSSKNSGNGVKVHPCACFTVDGTRQKQVCHSAQYHRNKCTGSPRRETSVTKTRSRSGSRLAGSRSILSLKESCMQPVAPCTCANPVKGSRVFVQSPRPRRASPVCVYSAHAARPGSGPRPPPGERERRWTPQHSNGTSDAEREQGSHECTATEESRQKLLLESRYIEERPSSCDNSSMPNATYLKRYEKMYANQCVCEICKRYHELFHADGLIS